MTSDNDRNQDQACGESWRPRLLLAARTGRRICVECVARGQRVCAVGHVERLGGTFAIVTRAPGSHLAAKMPLAEIVAVTDLPAAGEGEALSRAHA